MIQKSIKEEHEGNTKCRRAQITKCLRFKGKFTDTVHEQKHGFEYDTQHNRKSEC